MNSISDKTASVIDTSGLFLPLARRLAGHRGFGEVLYHNPNWPKGSPEINYAVIGDGYSDITWCSSKRRLKESDVFIFPDLEWTEWAEQLRDEGYPVWSPFAKAMRLEWDREYFLKTLEELGLDVPDYEVVEGLTALEEFLEEKEDIFIKVSKWRGSWETYRWRSKEEDGHRIPLWRLKFGPLSERIRFVCLPKIETKLEIGCDIYTVDGQWPSHCLHGIEAKDESYFSAVTFFDNLPEELTAILLAFSPLLKESGARTQRSIEVRVTEDKALFLDDTERGGLPSTGSQLLSMDNFPEVIYGGANGVLVQPEYNCKFTAECMVRIKGQSNSWETMNVAKELEPHLMLSDCCMVDERVWFPPDEEPCETVGWLVATGDTPVETAQNMNELADMLPDGADASVESLSEVIREIEEMQSKGLDFTKQKMPKPEVVLEPT